MLVASNLTHWGSPSDAGGLGSTRKEALGFQAWISIDFGRISGTPLNVFGQLWNNKLSFFVDMRACRSGLLKIMGSESGCLGLQNQVFGMKGIAEPAFHICRDYIDFGVIFTWFPVALGPILTGLGAGLKHHDFRWFSGVSRS